MHRRARRLHWRRPQRRRRHLRAHGAGARAGEGRGERGAVEGAERPPHECPLRAHFLEHASAAGPALGLCRSSWKGSRQAWRGRLFFEFLGSRGRRVGGDHVGCGTGRGFPASAIASREGAGCLPPGPSLLELRRCRPQAPGLPLQEEGVLELPRQPRRQRLPTQMPILQGQTRLPAAGVREEGLPQGERLEEVQACTGTARRPLLL
mmetsp:Transcript_71843/g.233492  ORF Transcript_71843/g.233492 Transcript_71843/m.233492 type:complete len:207 (-) Transcript_71843:2327-2947(-)